MLARSANMNERITCEFHLVNPFVKIDKLEPTENQEQ
jgi:hypothetical protein